MDKEIIYKTSIISTIGITVVMVIFIVLFFMLLIAEYYLISVLPLFVFFYFFIKDPKRVTILKSYVLCEYFNGRKKKIEFSEIKFVKFTYGGRGAIRVLLIKLNDNSKVVIDEKDLHVLVLILNTLAENEVKIIKDEFWLERIQFKDNKYIIDY